MGTVFEELSADQTEAGTSEIESLCMNCQKNGTTRLLLTKIPFYKEVILMSFECPECGYKNNEIQSGQEIQDKGITIKLELKSAEDMNRTVVKSEYAIISVPELELEIPNTAKKAEVTTVEGILSRTADDLASDQPVRRALDADAADKIDQFIGRLKDVIELRAPATMVLDDPSGNSYIENRLAPAADPQLHTTHYSRSREQDKAVGITPSYDNYDFTDGSQKQDPDPDRVDPDNVTPDMLKGEVLTFPTNCPSCTAPCQTNMKVTDIPHFKQVVIMATNCEACGARTNEVKAGCGIEPRGRRITLRITEPIDMSRDLLKSETCAVEIPELKIEAGAFTLSGRFTTVEGLLESIKEDLQKNPMFTGDSRPEEETKKMEALCAQIDEIIAIKRPATIILDDPAGNSHLQSVTAPEPDPNLTIEEYERTFEQNEELGLNDMKVENYS
ncbi:zinc finger protein ZPR1-like [Amphibalanus amphitrite]|uniref:zinc finger protein ZPR1-like n=1 Tax=Amphibalanus amphitrite TaxID=1232801 RepID=UPI001C9221B3|nr:zinc finger protein ZPR1-like [Amphibalanus amphitrite]XP_043239741.1 zinc finger protein ZPR1-like [Amphibalanus amphitrite]XP_043239742.1 zinc finger protein ZPR1-like [Amphibalanus amphitrite]XP_043239743.1 zinc finger protein ZPR1-like [Amphibalanus amphitrite]XP_043239744.1 zinc finger protein ZPR1-like [Amphibalanus amphitrite]